MPTLDIAIPSKWDEVIKAGNYSNVVQVLSAQHNSDEAFKMQLLRALNIITPEKLAHDLKLATPSARAEFAESMDYQMAMHIMDDVMPLLSFIYDNQPFYTNPHPTFTLNGVTYQGPEARLFNQTGEEWMISYQQQVIYSQQPSKETAVKIIAVNYHPIINGVRSQFNEPEFSNRVAELMELSEVVINGILLWYRHSDEWWFERFKYLFPEGEGTTKPKGFEVRHIIFEMAGNKLDGSWDIVKQRSRQEIFYALDRIDEIRVAQEEKQQ